MFDNAEDLKEVYISASYPRFGDSEFADLSRTLSSDQNGKIFRIYFQCGEVDEDSFEKWIQATQKIRNIADLRITFMRISDRLAGLLADFVKFNISIRTICITFWCVSPSKRSLLARAFLENLYSLRLNFRRGTTGLTDHQGLVEFFETDSLFAVFDFETNEKDGVGVLEELSCSNFDFDMKNTELPKNISLFNFHISGISDSKMRQICDSLCDNINIKALKFCGNSFGDEGSVFLSELISRNNFLELLDISFNLIGCNGAKSIAKALKTANNLRKLEICYNQIQDEGLIELLESLQESEALICLQVSHNMFGSKACLAIKNFLGINKSLEILDVSSNRIGVTGARFISEGLKSNQTLKSLIMFQNNIKSGMYDIGQALKDNSSLNKLILSRNQSSSEDVQSVIESLQENQTVSVLYIEQNEMNQKCTELAEKVLMENISLTYHLGIKFPDNREYEVLRPVKARNVTIQEFLVKIEFFRFMIRSSWKHQLFEFSVLTNYIFPMANIYKEE
jgi:hypothetical protein